jgi:hypothetical protein
MSPEKLHEKALFESALDLTDPAERRDFLARSCGADITLRIRLEKLLGSQEPAEAFLTLRPPLGPESTAKDGVLRRVEDHPPPEPLVRIGRYQLTQRLGEGGCGVVYLAEQQEPVRRPVALKIIRLGMDTENVIARFEMERQSLALMDHPNIARVLDAGATESGRPYFVMEVVQGVKITDYCDQNRLDIGRRLDLFVRVCQAIQHAHQKGVIHLDIKPSNILITLHDGLPVPKLIDFGIAKATGGHFADRTASATALPFIGTPAYMSPEQAETDGADVDTRGDIYSLGVLLGELLTGLAPFDLSPPPAEAGVDALRQFIRERRALAPSGLLASLAPEKRERIAAQRLTSSRRLSALLRDDLDCIVLKALQHDRRDRYETASALAADIRRCLDHEPVAAHPPGRLYRLRKLVRRNRGVFVAGTLVALALVAGLGASTWLFMREREARHEAEQSRVNEHTLREQAEARERFAQAAVLLNHGDIAAADSLIAALPLELTPPSLEAGGVLRVLGWRHALAGRWDLAAKRFAGMAKAITQVDNADTDEVSRLLLQAGAALGEAGDRDAYEWFRQMAIARFALSANPIAAEHTIKVSLLTPADVATLQKLAPLADVAAATLEGIDPRNARDPHMAAWRSFAIALFEYRRGRYEQALVWVQHCEASPNYNAARLASSRLIFAMACHHLHRESEAREALKQARELIDVRFRTSLDAAGSSSGFWFDWINARILLREATALIDDVSPASPPAH